MLGLLVAIAAGCAGPPSTPQRPLEPPPPLPLVPLLRSSADVDPREASVEAIGRAMPRVVLLLARRTDGSEGYGAGILLAEAGLVLTNLHVVAGAQDLRVLRYDPDRVSYSPLDGGLSRFVFENENALEPARLLRGDPILDLAVVKVEGTEGATPALTIRQTPPRPGEQVFALGHPQESVWSFTAGVVSATHQGVIQHDAPINQGNSGGPLVDAQGRLLGVNTMKLLGGSEGIGFARPMALTASLVDAASAPVEVDRSTPERAMPTCERAIELQPRAADACLAWESAVELARAAAIEAARLLELDRDATRRLIAQHVDAQAEVHVRRTRAMVLAHLAGEPPPEDAPTLAVPEPFASPAARREHLRGRDLRARLIEAQTAQLRAERAQQIDALAATGLQVDVSRDGIAYREVRRMGLRVEAVERVGDDAAWILVRGRNLDGSPFRYTECWLRADDGWRQPLFCADELEASRPETWPPPLSDTASLVRGRAILLAAQVAGIDLPAPSSEPSAP